MTDDGGLRVITARTTDTVTQTADAQGVRGEAARLFAELVTGAVLYRETMAPKLRVQLVAQGAAHTGQLVADSLPDGSCRGLVRQQEGHNRPDFGPGALLQVMRTLPRGEAHKGIVGFPATESISDALMAYMQSSEQIVSMISVGCELNESGKVARAGGYLVQLLPELAEAELAIMTERLHDFRSVGELLASVAATPDMLVDELLYGMPYTVLGRSDVFFRCSCNQVRVMTTLASLPRAELEELLAPGTPIEMSCDYCGADYAIMADQLRGLLAGS